MQNFVSKEGQKISTNIYWSGKPGLIGLTLCAALLGNAKQIDAVFLPWIFSTLVFSATSFRSYMALHNVPSHTFFMQRAGNICLNLSFKSFKSCTGGGLA